MNTQTQEALKIARDALGFKGVRDTEDYWRMMNKALAAVDEALESQEQKPVMIEDCNAARQIKEWREQHSQEQEPVALKFPTMLRKMWSGGEVQEWLDQQQPLYTHPAQPLSDDEINTLWKVGKELDVSILDFARAIEKAIMEKNNDY